MNKWSHLPNAKHIDWVLQSVNANLDTWVNAWTAAKPVVGIAAWHSARAAVLLAIWDAGREEAWDAAWIGTRGAVRSTAWEATWKAVWEATWKAARGSLRALIAYDDCEKYLNMSYEELLMWNKLDPHPACVLLLPYLFVKELTKEVDLV